MGEYFGKKYGQYVILEQLGEGGMAKVYNALDSRTQQNVAIKVILPGKHTSKVFLEQFEKEAKALANLTHTNIVKVLDYGIQDGQPYLVMEYVSGGSLKDAMKHKVPWQTAAAFLAPIARALDYVHRQQIVHRDVKPSNILLQADFRPMLADFGIVKLLENKDEKNDEAIGTGVGTPEYMSPEQGLGKDVDFRVDIYSLGLVFYEMITGQKPYSADSPIAVVIKHMTDKLPLPTKIDRNIPKFVEHVILRAVQKDPRNRFTSMAHFAEALELIAKGERASGRKISQISKQRDKRRSSISIYLLFAFLLLTVLGTSTVFYYYGLAGTPPASTVAGPVETESRGSMTPTLAPESAPTSMPTVFAAGSKTPTLATNPIPDMLLLETPIPANLPTGFKEIARWGLGGLNVVEWSPDGNTIALGTTSGIFLYEADGLTLRRFIDPGFNVLEMSFSPKGSELAAGSPKGVVKSWDPETGNPIQSFAYDAPDATPFAVGSPVTAISYTQDGQNIAVGYQNGTINYFASDQGTSLFQFANPPEVTDLAIDREGLFIYVSNGTENIDIWNVSKGEKKKEPLVNGSKVRSLRMSNDRALLLAGGIGKAVYLWDLDSLSLMNSFANLDASATDFGFSFDNQYVAIGMENGAVKIFKTPSPEDIMVSPELISTFQALAGRISTQAFAPNKLVVASGNNEESLKVLDLMTGEKLFELNNSMAGIRELYFSQDGRWLATDHDHKLVRVWNVREAKEVLKVEGYLPKGSPFSPNNQFLTFIHSPGNNRPHIIQIIDLNKLEISARLSGYQQRSFVEFRNDSKILIMGDPYSAKAWDVATWEELKLDGGPTAGCGQYTSPQKDLLAVISNAGIIFTFGQDLDVKFQDMCATKPTGATFKYFFRDQNILLFVLGDGKIWKGNSKTRDYYRLPQSGANPASDDIFLAGDWESGWYAYVAEKIMRIENINSNFSNTVIEGQDDFQFRVALLPGQRMMALGSRYGSIHIWSMP